jgi:hypothetical protein
LIPANRWRYVILTSWEKVRGTKRAQKGKSGISCLRSLILSCGAAGLEPKLTLHSLIPDVKADLDFAGRGQARVNVRFMCVDVYWDRI